MPVSFLFGVLKGAPPLALWGVIFVLFIGVMSLGVLYKNALKENANLEVQRQLSAQNVLTLQNTLNAQNAKIEALRVDSAKVQKAQGEIEKLYLQNQTQKTRVNTLKDEDCQAQLEAINNVAEVFFR